MLCKISDAQPCGMLVSSFYFELKQMCTPLKGSIHLFFIFVLIFLLTKHKGLGDRKLQYQFQKNRPITFGDTAKADQYLNTFTVYIHCI